MKKRLPIGNDDFAEVRKQNLYFIDKSLMIRDFLDTGDKVTLITQTFWKDSEHDHAS